MDIFNRPPGISEDTLQYALYPSPDNADKSSVTGLAALIEEYVKELLPDFIWHRDAFELKVVPDDYNSSKNKENEGKWMLEGRVRVGDSVDDEWCVVWLLCEISKKWDVAVTVFDSDGEFLLIEAAEYLPSWVTPSNSENRVWLYRGNLHLIPLSYQSASSTKPDQHRRRTTGNESDEGENFADEDDAGWLSVQDALNALRSSDPTEAPKEVQNAVWKRISSYLESYPAAARQHIHITKAFIPVDVAKALVKDPSLVQRAVETFYTRDAIQLRAAHKMSRFPPQTSGLSPVRMTRTAYAQLVGQKFHPPKIFGQFKEREETKEWRWRDIGMKIGCGFEMLYQETKPKSDASSVDAQKASVEARKDALRRRPEYNDYIKKLKSMGYFKNELEGSQLWNELEDRAAEVFVNSRRDDDASRLSFATLVNNAIAQAGENPTLPNLEEEPDDWLNVDAENFDEKLAETMRPKATPPEEKKDAMDVDQPDSTEDAENQAVQAQADKLKNLAKKVEKFVEGEGTLEGAVFEDEQMSEDDQLSEFSEEEFPSESEDDNMQQVEETGNAAENAARNEAMAKLVPALDPGDYGKMPADFYSNSQRVAPVTMETEARDDLKTQSLTSPATTGKGKAAATETPPKSKPIRRPILPRDDFDGVDSDDETDEGVGDEEEDEEDRPQVVGEIEIDMREEQDEFLEFSRTALGISDDMWNDILRERQGRGAYIPKGIEVKQYRPKEQKPEALQEKLDEGPKLREPQSGPRPNVNPNLDSFEAVMEAMEAELQKARLAKKPFSPEKLSTKPVSKGKGKEKAVNKDVDEQMDAEDDDIEAAMDAELRAALEREEGDSGDEEPMDYGMIRNFLESFKSQAGLAGPVSSLAGRLEPGWFPRDES
ncbi:SGT1-domain-containing protein [Fomitiporia mediterranea MF3/22]|uniref:SGT1-domain-containing protein n=1 Tax=Fomitiporia mediterranea (strain MF3/22) TaxID=694068 RepID=UPI000440995F|nr:SGT1-domain-containing protein [Fomitiporia mediterranea MF3/22]EJD04343.1 SGT1-domain-containing protein [Fomitiporia mediterranea MF3/22]